MNPKLKDIWEHILRLGLDSLTHANRLAAYSPYMNDSSLVLSVPQAAHAAELLIKARIAQEHPLLIFEQLPRSRRAAGDLLDLEDLFQQGRTLQWSDLPDRLWAATGMTIPNLKSYEEFGKLRNGIQHFGAPVDFDVSETTLRFVFGFIDPFIHECWDLFAVDYDEDIEPYVYFIPTLITHEIKFLVSQEAAETFEDWEEQLSSGSGDYYDEMRARFRAALEK